MPILDFEETFFERCTSVTVALYVSEETKRKFLEMVHMIGSALLKVQMSM